MENKDILEQIKILEDDISKLPKGYISKKVIFGKPKKYLQWQENGKKYSKYIKQQDLLSLEEKINKRRELQSQLKELKKSATKTEKAKTIEIPFRTNIKIGEQLYDFAKSSKELKKRDCFSQLNDYLYNDVYGKVFILYGLRRTGKTTLIRQCIAEMTDMERKRSAFIQITSKDNLANVNFDLKLLEKQKIKYVFIDEVTLMEDFIEGSALFSDLYATSGMKIVLSGTDSLGFMFTQDEQLYDRCIMLHTTFIPYREFERVLDIKSIDEYIRFGGTMSVGGKNYNQGQIFANEKTTNEYVDSAISRNIQHSLKCYQYEGHFRNLEELFKKNELTSAINRVIEDMNHNFTIEVLTKDFVSNDLGISAKNLRKDKNSNDILDNIDKNKFIKRLKQALEIKNSNERVIEIKDCHRVEIKEYLKLLDLIEDIDILNITSQNEKKQRIVFTQPGMRYSQAQAFAQSLLEDEKFGNLSAIQKKYVLERITNEIKGRMLEDIIILETKLKYPEKKVFKLQFAIGEFDMVIADTQNITCEIYEIKHSDKIVNNQYRYLTDKEKCDKTEFRFGKITRKAVIYRGENKALENGIQFLNVENYLLFFD